MSEKRNDCEHNYAKKAREQRCGQVREVLVGRKRPCINTENQKYSSRYEYCLHDYTPQAVLVVPGTGGADIESHHRAKEEQREQTRGVLPRRGEEEDDRGDRQQHHAEVEGPPS